MVVVFANNQVMLADNTQSPDPSITTDPVPMNGNDRLTPILNIHTIFGGVSLTATCQVSNDGQNWVDSTLDQTVSTEGQHRTVADTTQPNAFVRWKFSLGAPASGMAFVIFDLHVEIDHF